MRRVGCRVLRAEPVQKRDQMRPVARAVALDGLGRFLDRKVDRLARG
jgi:hypothetical protein